MLVVFCPEATASEVGAGADSSAFVGEPALPVEPLGFGDFLLTAILVLLSAGSVALILRFRLLRTAPLAVERYDEIEKVRTGGPIGNRNVGLLLILGSMLVWVGAMVGGSMGQALTPADATDLQVLVPVLAGMSISVLGLTAIAWGAWPPLGRMLGLPSRFAQLGPDLVKGFFGLLLTLPLVLLASMVVSLSARFSAWRGWIAPPEQVAHETLRQLVTGPKDASWWAVVVMVIVAIPIVEEVMYRGLLQSGIRAGMGTGPSRRVGRLDWAAVAFASLIFTLVHITAADWYSLPVLFVLSVAMGIAYERTGRLLVPIVIHVGFNAFNIVTSQLL